MTRKVIALAGVVALAVPLVVAGQASADAPLADLTTMSGPDALSDTYIVMLKETRSSVLDVKRSADRARSAGAQVTKEYTGIGGFLATMNEDQLTQVRRDPRVLLVQQSHTIRVSTVPNSPEAEQNRGSQTNATWGLDRIDQRDNRLDRTYKYQQTGKGVTAYVFDTGINPKHTEFTGRIGEGFNAVKDGKGTDDCNRHGTHVSGTVGGKTWGVAKDVTIVPIRVIGCKGDGPDSDLVDGLDWLTKTGPKLPAVANMSVGSDDKAPAIDEAVKRLIAKGVTVVAATGNDGGDACGQAPSRVPDVISVGNSTKNDKSAPTSNTGSCLDLFAPGTDITSADYKTNTGSSTLSGTSMASPHVAGAVALYLELKPQATPAEVTKGILDAATKGKIGGGKPGTANLLLFNQFTN